MNHAAESMASRPPGRGGLYRRLVLNRLAGLERGALRIDDGLDRLMLGTASAGQPCPGIRVHDQAFYRHVALGGGTGAGEAYIEGLWDCDDLVGALRLLARNRDALARLDSGPARLAAPLLRGWHALRRNTRGGSRRNIAAHYDLGNELFRLFLDDDLVYSSAVFEQEGMTLEQAQQAKFRRICGKLDLSAGHHVLEIGSGWGGFALHAARHHGCRVTTTTISREQYELARRRVADAGLADRVTVLLEDYRDLGGQYDRLVSIEMVEAVGHQYLDTFFRHCGKLLKDDGAMLLQAITIEDHRYRQALRRVDFIKRFVFPGCFIPSASALLGAAARTSDLRLINMEDIGPSYAATLACWRERFEANAEQVTRLGYPPRFLRLWRFYLAYCEAGFHERAIGDAQMLLVRPGNRRGQLAPPMEPRA